jgi:predicted metallo-beta-lactamase superfamily hydrolase
MSHFTAFGQNDPPLARHSPYLTTVYQKSDKKSTKIQSKIQIQIRNPNQSQKIRNPNSIQNKKQASKSESKQNQEFNLNSKAKPEKTNV